ncbi:SoxR reducing system RseC family protein [Shewanella maritima]|uniref:SoxR reducing system RseC family protein n=1 Tax=Shewanella maritima TaxID=2520507 RepID=UPI003736C905
MLEELASVVAYDNGWATVEVELKSACNHCQNSEQCGTSAVAKAFSVKTQQFSIATDRVCDVGDILKIALPESVVVKAAAIVYLSPLLGLMLAAFLGQSLGYALDIDANLAASILGLLGGFAGWLLGKRAAKKLESQATPIVVKYLGKNTIDIQQQD